MKLTHSYSSLQMYENCPKRYYHQRITKEVKDEGGPATIYGERVHKALEDRLLGKQAELSKETVQYEPLCQAVEAMASGGVLTAEEEMTLDESLKPTGWWDDDAWIRSKIDVLVRKGSKAVVLDWKTGKRRLSFDQLELFALQTFSHYQEVKEVTSTFVWLKDRKFDSEVYTRGDEPRLWSKLLSKVHRIEESVAHNNWPAKPSGLCGWCPCRSFCPYAK